MVDAEHEQDAARQHRCVVDALAQAAQQQEAAGADEGEPSETELGQFGQQVVRMLGNADAVDRVAFDAQEEAGETVETGSEQRVLRKMSRAARHSVARTGS